MIQNHQKWRQCDQPGWRLSFFPEYDRDENPASTPDRTGALKKSVIIRKKFIVIPSGLGFKKRQHGCLGHRLQQGVAPGAARKKRQRTLKAEKRQDFD